MGRAAAERAREGIMMQRAMMWLGLAALSATTMACGGEEGGGTKGPTTQDDGITDVRVAIPAAEDGVLDIVSGEIVIEPGTEKMFCFHYTYDGETTAVGNVDMLQGKFGHHAIMVATTDPQPHGTVEDCTDQKEMQKYSALFFPTDEMPEGFGLELPSGFQMVLQAHYVNTSPDPIRIRDVVRLHTTPVEDIDRWVATITTNDFGMVIPALTPAESTFDCAIEEDVDLLLVGGHMHEYGTSFRFEVGPNADGMETLYDVPEWDSEYRDAPPVELMFDNPLTIPAGSVARTSCTWDNSLEHELLFPEEMCSTFGYIAGTKKHYDCRVGLD
jgi:hypothetical protein